MAIIFKKILVPTDNSENSREAFKYAMSIAEIYETTVYVVHVIDIDHLEKFYKFETSPYASRVDMKENIVKKEMKETEEFINKNIKGEKGLKMEKIIKKGNPFVKIIIAAREIEADLIVMSTHGRIGLFHVLMESVAERVVRTAPCPVLTLKTKDFKFRLPCILV